MSYHGVFYSNPFENFTIMTEIICPQNCLQSLRNDFLLRDSFYRIYYFRTIRSIALDFKTVCIKYNQQRYSH